jgi:hypothetical protein
MPHTPISRSLPISEVRSHSSIRINIDNVVPNTLTYLYQNHYHYQMQADPKLAFAALQRFPKTLTRVVFFSAALQA